MTGPSGEKPHGWWRIEALDQPRRIEFANGLAGDDGEPIADVEPMGGASRSRVRRRHPDDRAARVRRRRAHGGDARMGMGEGIKQAMGQIDALLATAAV